jgi:hypothetical protein
VAGFKNASGITVLSGAVTTPGPGSGVTTITNFSGTLAANVPLGINTTTLLFTTPVLAIGTWLITAEIEVQLAATCVNPLVAAVINNASANANQNAITGPAIGPTGTPANGIVTLTFSAIFTVIGAGTMTISARSLDTVAQGTALLYDNNFGGGRPATCWSAIRLA